MGFSFLENKNDSVILKEGKLEIYLPKSYFDNEDAIEFGMEIKTIGIFLMRYYKDENSSSYKTYQLVLPEQIQFSFSERTTSTESLNKNLDEDSYNIFILYENDFFIKNINIAKDSANTSDFVNLHNTAKIPNTIEYHEILNLYLENMITNDCDLKVPAVIHEMIIGELARYKNNIEIPFRRAISSSDKITEYDYKQISIKDLAMINGTFTALSSENINQAITMAISKTRTGGYEAETPVEKIIKC
jgi:hypothetical protein